ncbi:hypothetical protein PoB_007242700 [Plakobranchus ocellatus]|uniref:Uncharacterized protein n=1 Tax=Plakobranchus ocellatus TaxID=259542 RepID=A0AAV4DP92_9GAST|nr:hypothetical protein PoB_007242700 [Plakobranchus ocellatus]
MEISTLLCHLKPLWHRRNPIRLQKRIWTLSQSPRCLKSRDEQGLEKPRQMPRQPSWERPSVISDISALTGCDVNGGAKPAQKKDLCIFHDKFSNHYAIYGHIQKQQISDWW